MFWSLVFWLFYSRGIISPASSLPKYQNIGQWYSCLKLFGCYSLFNSLSLKQSRLRYYSFVASLVSTTSNIDHVEFFSFNINFDWIAYKKKVVFYAYEGK
jgi:hypothetical protein